MEGKLSVSAALRKGNALSLAQAAVKEAPAEPDGHWLDVYRPVACYWLRNENGSYQTFTDRLSRYRRVQQLRLQGIDCIVGTDWQSQKIGRIFVRGESEGQN